MSTNLSRFFRQRRLDLGLRLPDAARMCGYQNLGRGSNRIDRFEQTGEIHVGLYPKLVAALGIDQEICDRLNEEDRQQARRVWLEYINTPIKPHVVFRAIPCVFIRKELPEECKTIEEMESFASEYASDIRKKVWLVVSRKLTIHYDESGHKVATTDHPNSPHMQLKRGRPFLFGCDGGLSVKPQPPRLPQEQADD